MRKHGDRVRGFTLMELAMVLVVISLVIGGVMVGRNMIADAELKANVSETNEFIAAMQRFQTTYGYLPGDIPNASSFFGGVTNGNGNGIIDSNEALLFWQHLSSSGFIKQQYDGATNTPGVGVPKGMRDGMGYTVANDLNLGTIFELSAFQTTTAGFAALSPQDAGSLDQMFDDGNPTTGTIRASDGSDTAGGCLSSNDYILDSSNKGCVLMIAASRSGTDDENAQDTDVACGVIGDTRTSGTACPTGYVGEIVETCAQDGTWQESHFNCSPISCGQGYTYGDTREAPCPAGYTGTLTQVCQLTWEVQTNNCVADSPCSPDGSQKTVACTVGETGHILVECIAGSWDFASPVEDTCAPVACGGAAVGDTQTVACPAGYTGNVTQICAINGQWESRFNTCVPDNGDCSSGSVGDTQSLACPDGEQGQVIQTCTAGSPDYWSTTSDTCVSTTCDGEPIGYSRQSQTACSSGMIGVVIEVCTDTGAWAQNTDNCTLNVTISPPACTVKATTDLSALDGTDGVYIQGHGGDGGWGQMGDNTIAGIEPAGDVNGDGLQDFVIEAKWSGSGGVQTDEAYLIFGQSASTWTATAGLLDTLALDGTNGIRFYGGAITSVGHGGDVNGDGIDDIIINAAWRGDGATVKNGSYIIFGRSEAAWSALGGYVDVETLIDGTNAVVIDGPFFSSNAGADGNIIGDVNDDGIGDIVLNDIDYYGGGDGTAWVVFGKSAAGWLATGGSFDLGTIDGTNGVTINTITTADWLASSNYIGDANGDGIDDILLGAFAGDGESNNSGQAYIIFGKNAAGWAATSGTFNLSSIDGANGVTLNGITSSDDAGYVAAGDFNGDGRPDILIGAPQADPGGNSSAGETYVVFGMDAAGWAATSGSINLSTLDGTTGVRFDGPTAGKRAGEGVANAGDVSGDGIDDIFIGSNNYGAGNAGRVYIVYGRITSDWAATSGVYALSTADKIIDGYTSGRVGYSIAGVGDTSGDGVDDIAFCAPYIYGNEGACFLVFGPFDMCPSDCGATPDFSADNATVGAGDSTPGAVRTVACDAGYTGTDTTIVCQAGNWAGAAPTCSVGCGSPPVIANVVWSGGSTAEGATQVATCDSSTWYWGMPQTYTCSSGSWTGTSPSCYLLDCSGSACVTTGDPQECTVPATCATKDCSSATPPSAPTGAGMTQPTGNGYADYVEYICDTCFGSSTTATGSPDGAAICDNTNGWKGKPPSCSFSASMQLSTLDGTNGVRLNGVAAFDRAGRKAALIGDVNDDGIEDVLFPAWDADPGGNARSGSTYLVFGKNAAGWTATSGTMAMTGLNGTTGVRLDGPTANGRSGWSVSTAGDVNDDGIEDFLIGEAYNGSGGYVYLVFGKSAASWTAGGGTLTLSSLDGTTGVKFTAEAASDRLGQSISRAGDVNGDGIDDIIIGAYWATVGANSAAGKSYIIFGKSAASWTAGGGTFSVSSVDGTNGVRLNGVATDDNSGIGVSGGGDINNDGIDDVIIGAWTADPSAGADAGSSYIVFGKNVAGWTATSGTLALSSLDGTTGVRLDGAAAGELSGAVVKMVGDVNGDSIDDVAVSASSALSGAGSSYVVFGKSAANWTAGGATLALSSLNGTNGVRLNGSSSESLGTDISDAGDVNNDGLADIIIGAYMADPSAGADAGSSYLVLGRSAAAWTATGGTVALSSLDGSTGMRFDGVAAGDNSGIGVGGGYDVNADGFDDIIIGAVNADPGGVDTAGSAWVVFGPLGPQNPENTVSNGSIGYSYDTNTDTWTATLTCDSGYTLTGNATATCTSGNSTWTALGTCEPPGCGSPPVIANVVWSGGGTSNGDTQVAKCDSATWYWGMPITYTCNNGSWMGSAPSCFLLDCSGSACVTTGDPQECTVPATCSGLSCSGEPSPGGAVVMQASTGSGYAGYRDLVCDACFGYSGTSGKVMCDNTQNWRGTAASCSASTFFHTEEQRVNTHIPSDQDGGDIAVLTGGGYVITWVSDDAAQDGSGDSVFFQLYDSGGNRVGTETRINTTTAGSQNYSKVAALSDGGFVIAWAGPSGGNNRTFFQRYNASGVAQGSETLVATSGTEGWEGRPVLLSNGNFVVLNFYGDGSSAGIYGTVYTSAGALVSGPTRINTTTAGDQRYPDAVLLPNGNLFVIWTSSGQDGGGWGVYGQVVDSSMTKVGSEFRVNTYTTGDQGLNGGFAIDLLTTGNVVAVWGSVGQDGDQSGVYGQIFNDSGTKVGGEFRINTTTAGIQKYPDVTALPDGNFMAFWESQNIDGDGYGIAGQLFDSSASKVGGERMMNLTVTSDQRGPDAALLPDGKVALTYIFWSSEIGNTCNCSPGYEKYLRVLDPMAEGVQDSAFGVTNESIANGPDQEDKVGPSIAMLADGGYVVAWDSRLQDGSGYGVYFQRFSAPGVKAGSETRINVTTTGDQAYVKVAGLTGGGFVAVWNDYNTDVSRFRVYDASGAPVTSEVTYESNTGSQVIGLANGNFMVASHPTVVSSNDIWVEVFNPAGTQIGSGVRVNNYTTNAQKYTEMAQLTGGNVAVIWSSAGQDGSGSGVYGRIIDSTGAVVGSEFRANTYTAGDQAGNAVEGYNASQVAALSNGGFVAIWDSNAQDGSGWGIYGQVFDAAGTKVGSEFRVNTTTAGDQMHGSVTGLANGYFFVVWESVNVDDDEEGLVGQLFDSSGNKVGYERLINQDTEAMEEYAFVRARADGKVIVAWNSDSDDWYEIFHRVMNPFAAFSPSDLPGLRMWLRADQGVVKDGSNVVTTWWDQSIAGNNATQATATNKPLWVANQINGKPVVRFDGTDDYMSMASLRTLRDVYGGSIFAVIKRNGAGGVGSGSNNENTILDIATNSTANPRYEFTINASNAYKLSLRRSDSNTTAVLSGGTSNTTAFALASAQVDYYYRTAYLYADGTQLASNTALLASGDTSDTDSAAIRLGSQATSNTGFLNADIAEIIVYNYNVTDSGRKAVECYLSDKYALGLTGCPAQYSGGSSGLNSDNGSIGYSFNGTQWTGTLTCGSGYAVSGSSTASCDPTVGSWSSLGSCISAFTPASIPNLKLWLDGSDSTTITSASGRITQWNDKSGQGNNVTAASTSRPYTGRTMNGLGVVDFQNGQEMASGNPWASGTLSQPNTMFVVEKQDAIGEDCFTNADSNWEVLTSLASNAYYMDAGSGITSAAIASTNPTILTGRFSGATSKLYVNGTQAASGNVGTLALTHIIVGGGTSPSGSCDMDGAIAEVLVYNSALSDTDRATVECYLADKWGIAVAQSCP